MHKVTLDRPKVAIFLPSLRGGGAERMMLHLAIEFAERGYPVDLVLAKAAGTYQEQVPSLVNVIDLNASHVVMSLPGLIGYLNRNRPVALLAAMSHANLIALWAKSFARTNTRVVVSERNNLSADTANAPQTRARLIPILVRQFYGMADAITAVSTNVAEDLAQITHIPKENIHVVYNPTVTPRLLKQAAEPVTDPWFQQPRDLPVILAAGRLAAQKGFSTLIRAFAKVTAALPARLVILGEGEKRAELTALVQDLELTDNVSLPGFAQNPYAYMKHADVFVLSSLWEGFPNVLVEAMACGCPVISTDCPGGSREILADGKYGTLVPVDDIDAMAEAIRRILGQPQDIVSIQNRASEFSAERIADHYLRLLLAEER